MRPNSKYNEIIKLPHHVSKKHPQMSLYARSAQFAPFAALTGYEDIINETSKENVEKIELDNELKAIIDMKLHIIQERIKNKPKVNITYFILDYNNKGSYITVNGIVNKINLYNQYILLADETKIPILDILNITIF